MRTTRAPIVLGVCGWALAPRTAHPRVGSALSSFTWGQCSTVSGCAAHYHTLEQPQSLSTRRTCVPRGRGSTTRPITPTHGPEDSTSRDTVPARAISASLHAPHSVSWPHTAFNPPTRPFPPPGDPHPRPPFPLVTTSQHPSIFRQIASTTTPFNPPTRPLPPPGDPWPARARRAGRVGPGWPHGPWRLPAIEGTPHGRHFPPRITILVLTPPSKRYQQHASARSWHRLVAPSCCPSARVRRSGPVPAWDRLHGRQICVVPVARRPSRLVPLPWVAAHPQALVQLVQLMCAF